MSTLDPLEARPEAIGVRRLGPDDIMFMRALNAMFAAAFEDAQSYAAEPPDDDYLIELLGRESVVVLVALDGGDVVGGLVAYELPKFERARSNSSGRGASCTSTISRSRRRTGGGGSRRSGELG